MEIKLWMVVSVLGFIVPLFIWLAKLGINRILAKLDEVIKSNAEFKTELVRQNGEIKRINLRVEDNHIRLNDHSRRIKDLEIEQAKRD